MAAAPGEGGIPLPESVSVSAVMDERREISSTTAAAPVMASTRAKASPSMEISLVSFPGPAAADTRDAA